MPGNLPSSVRRHERHRAHAAKRSRYSLDEHYARAPRRPLATNSLYECIDRLDAEERSEFRAVMQRQVALPPAAQNATAIAAPLDELMHPWKARRKDD
jgi:hypothetical protein